MVPMNIDRPDAGTDISRSDVTILLSRSAIIRSLFLVILGLMILSIAGQVAKHGFGYPTIFGLVEFTYVDEENNLPTWYASIQLLACGVLLAFIAIGKRRNGDRWAAHWLWLSVIFVIMSLDEMGSMHERLIDPMARLTGGLPGAWQPLWIIPILGLVAVVVIAYLRFVFAFPWRERLQIIVAAAIFVGGAVGMEMYTAAQFDTTDPLYKEQPLYVVLAHIEEGMEKIGILIFLDFLLRYLARTGSTHRLVVRH
jgi:hypothetical protein